MKINKPVVRVIFFILIIQFIFFAGKVLNIFDWDWGWVLSPLWIPYALMVTAGIILIVYLLIYDIIGRIRKHG